MNDCTRVAGFDAYRSLVYTARVRYKEATAPMHDIFVDDWVDTPDDPSSWENGLRGLSRAIVSGINPLEKEELKTQLDQYITAALSSTNTTIRQTGFFYSLAWKRFELISVYEGTDRESLLQGALERLYEKYEFHYFSLKQLVRDDWPGSVSSVARLLQKKLADHERVRFAEGLASADEAVVDRTLHSIDECVRVLGIPVAEFTSVLSGFWKKSMLLTGDLIAAREIKRSQKFFLLIESVRELLQVFGVNPTPLLLSYLDIARDEDLFFGFRCCLCWRCRAGVDKALAKTWPLNRSTIARLIQLHLDSPLLDQRRCEEILALAGTDKEAVLEILDLCMDPAAPAPLLASAIEAGLADQTRCVAVFVLTGAMIEGMQLECEDIILTRTRFLARLWSSVEGSVAVELRKETLELLYRLVEASGDSLLEGEFFLPLLRDCLLSEKSEVHRIALGLVQRSDDLKRVVQSWLSEPQLQNDLAAGLLSAQLQDQVRSLNRLLALYCRYPVSSMYLSKHIGRYLEQLEKSALAAGLRLKMKNAAIRIKACVAERLPQGHN